MSKKIGVECGCGCGKIVPHNRLETLEINVAHTNGTVKPAQRYLVHRDCYEPFTQELAAEIELSRFVIACYRINFIRRFFRHKQLVRFSHAIHDRRLGFAAAKKKATRSAIIFSTPQWLGVLFEKRWQKQDAKLRKNNTQNAVEPTRDKDTGPRLLPSPERQ